MIFYENKFFILSIGNNILSLECKSETIIDLITAQSIVAKRMQLQENKVYPLFLDMRNIIDSDKAGRDYLAQYGFILIKAAAILVKPGVSSIITSFYLKRYNSEVSVQVFTEKVKALEFLDTFK
ncbi:hypothetical protein SGQ83_00490 [Flavobacterium sp. Fl-318]|uniref:DUF7793 domain-containing protein n=1 Tax=Flavobacterium cupriresistens TaxID=2893885 RepID=A0ABU4R5G0_9FLAO|nr:MULTISPECIES: hypothetical protein [unclassified Flavobacterium]MDX6187814.1 hypothetical protein [Flavobacterium sp. Fl-318]UFH42264.1 hypothetical protein LNP23_20960 [Flavobacterium sp. F-323]